MILRFRLIALVFLVTVCVAVTANAQNVSISASGYKNQQGAQTAQPDGTVSYPAPPAGTRWSWEVTYDYGSISNGNIYTPDPNIHPGTTPWAHLFAVTGGNANWAAQAADTLTNPPASFYVRAQLTRWFAGNWIPQSTAYKAIP